MTDLDVLFPVKNGIPYVEAAIESILSQSFGDFRLLVIDDGSEDDTPALVAKLAASDSRIVLVPSEGSGLIDALNQGLARSTSPFLARMDSDDVAMPSRFEKQLSYLRRHPEIDVLGGWVQLIDKNGGTLASVTEYPTSPGDLKRRLFANCNPLVHPTVMMRTDTVKRLGGYRTAMKAAEDFDLWLRVAESGELANLPEILVRYRIHPGQVSAAQRLAQSFASELAFRCSEERRSGNVDPIDNANETESWPQTVGMRGTPALKDLCDRFDAIGEVIHRSSCPGDVLRVAVEHMEVFRQSMTINHRLYADVSAAIAAQALRSGEFSVAVRALAIGSRQNMGRFIRTSLRQFAISS